MHPLLAEMTPGTLAVLGAVGLMTCMLLVRTQRQLKSRSGSHTHSHAKAQAPAPARESARTQTQVTRQMEHWEVRMHDLARDLSGQLDSKMVALELLVREAQEQIARLERLTRSAQSASPPTSEPAPSQSTAPPQLSTSHLGTQAAALPRSPQRPHLLAPARSHSRRHQDVYALADAGQSSAAIAQQLGSPIGEVELILGLRRDQPAG